MQPFYVHAYLFRQIDHMKMVADFVNVTSSLQIKLFDTVYRVNIKSTNKTFFNSKVAIFQFFVLSYSS